MESGYQCTTYLKKHSFVSILIPIMTQNAHSTFWNYQNSGISNMGIAHFDHGHSTFWKYNWTFWNNQSSFLCIFPKIQPTQKGWPSGLNECSCMWPTHIFMLTKNSLKKLSLDIAHFETTKLLLCMDIAHFETTSFSK